MGLFSRLLAPRRLPLGLKGKNSFDARDLRVCWNDTQEAVMSGLGVERASGDISLEDDSGPVLDQGATYSCVGNSIADAEKTTLKACYGVEADLGSRRFIYYMSRRMHENPVIDFGTYIRSACQAISKFGIIPERYFPFSTWKIDEKPPIDILVGAFGRRGIRGYYAIDDDGDELVAKLLAALHSRRAIVCGVDVDRPFVSTPYGRKVIAWPPQGRIEGGHALEIVGAQSVAGEIQFRVKSSWGTMWADNGYAWLEAGWILNGHSFEIIDPVEP
jgi:papain like protease